MKKIILMLCIIISTVTLCDSDFDKVFEMIIQNEGTKYVDNREISEISKFGITLETLQDVDYDVNHDGWINKKDVKDLTLSKARRLYVAHYYTPIKELKLVDGKYAMNVYRQVLDIGVSMGVVTSVMMLQTAMNDYIRVQRHRGRKGFNYVNVDGIIGTETLDILERCKLSDINNRIVKIRKAKYTSIYRKNPEVYRKWYRGWLNRVDRYYIK